MASLFSLTEKHNILRETTFWSKSQVFVLKRSLQNLLSGIKRFNDSGQLKNAPIIAISGSDLWNPEDNEQNKILTAGKIQNLRIAIKKLNGFEISAGEVFSFWRYIGIPSQSRGYVIGREIREGCIVPTIAGGLCQLSNALYDAALKAGFEIIERHKHTKVIKGSLAEQDRDATVKWNYVDLRFRSGHSFRIDIDITADKLIVKFRSTTQHTTVAGDPNILLQSSKLNDCFSCGNTTCFKHPDKSLLKKMTTSTTYILDEQWPEYDEYIRSVATADDHFVVPVLENKFISAERYQWKSVNREKAIATTLASLKRTVMMRFSTYTKANVFELSLRLDRDIAKAAARLIPIESTHLIVSQNLLPYLWEQGALGGRTYDVLMTRLPMEKLHERLNTAHTRYPESKTLNDFRASDKLLELENIALTRSRKIITPHQEIADLFINKVVRVDWSLPKAKTAITPGTKILFPASSLGRKGAYEIRQLARELALTIVIAGKATEQDDFWKGVSVEYAEGDPLNNISRVIFPTYVEHQPRLLLRAIANGIPVITTSAAGLPAGEHITIIPVGDYDALRHTVLFTCSSASGL
ncbi:MAG: hypothetical protein JWO03_365 [Bacteroidetes bacterium]|nr:hypothetical protein [Bacteroidota bacterium]